MQTELTFSLVDFHASPTALPENEKVKMMNATCGQKCLEQLEKFPHVGLWAKMFSALLIGMEGWYSTKCKLTWKLKGTKYNRLFFQLAPSTHRTEGIGFGLWPTPLKNDYKRAVVDLEKNTKYLEKHQMTFQEFLLHNGVQKNEVVKKYAEAMGYPQNWTELPFQNGLKNQSEHMETQ